MRHDTKRKEVRKIKGISIEVAARALNKSQQFVRVGLQRGTLNIGIAEKMPNSSRYTYYISPVLLENLTGQVFTKEGEET